MLLSLGLLAALVAYNGLIVRAIVVDGDVAERAAATALRDERMQELLASSTADAIDAQYLRGAADALQASGYDASADVRRVADAVVADPRFADAFGTAVRDLHDYVLVEHDTVPTVDATALLDAARAAAIAQNPQYATLLPEATTLHVSLPAADLPDLTGVSGAVSAQAKVAALLALLLVGAAFAVHSHRPTVIRRVGTWLLGIAIVQGAVAMTLPYAAGWLPTDAQPVGRAIASTLQPRLLVPAAMIAAAGAALVIGAWRWTRSINATHERAGATAFLGADLDEPFVNPSMVAGRIETATLRSPMGAPPVPLVSAAGDVMPTTRRGA